MPRVPRASDVIEILAERSLMIGIGGLSSLAVGGLLIRYRGQGYLTGLITVLFVIGLVGVALSTYFAFQVRKVTTHEIKCPYCEEPNVLVDTPTDDFPCVKCNRMIPIVDGKTVPVSQVRCGYCNELNFYSQKTEVLLCEKCNHEIPIAVDENGPRKTIPAAFVVVDDEALYELQLVGQGHKTEELINALQHMLALNRNQVKNMLNELPVTVLTGITRKKAEMLKAQLGIYEGEVEYHPMEEARR